MGTKNFPTPVFIKTKVLGRIFMSNGAFYSHLHAESDLLDADTDKHPRQPPIVCKCKAFNTLFKGPLLYCFSLLYYRSQIYTKHVSEVFGSKYKTDHALQHPIIPSGSAPFQKVLILCLLL